MSNHLYISYQNDFPTSFSLIDEKAVIDFSLKVLEHLKKDNWDVSIFFCFDSFIQELNKTYRNIDSPTDVLSFEMGEYYENEELKRLIIHAILHLSGMDHTDNAKDQPMLILQEDILKLFSSIEIIREKNETI